MSEIFLSNIHIHVHLHVFFGINITINICFMNCVTFYALTLNSHMNYDWQWGLDGLDSRHILAIWKSFCCHLLFPARLIFMVCWSISRCTEMDEKREKKDRPVDWWMTGQKWKWKESLAPFTQVLCSLTVVLLSFSVNIVQIWVLIQSNDMTYVI